MKLGQYFLFAFAVFFAHYTFANNIDVFSERPLLIKEFNQGKLDGTYLGYLVFDENLNQFVASKMSITSNSFLGLCIKDDLSPCKRKITYKELLTPAFQMQSAKFSTEGVPNLPEIEVTIHSKILATDFDNRMIKMSVEAFGKSVIFELTAVTPIKDEILKFPKLETVVSNRKDVTEVDSKLQQLSTSVVQIKKGSDKNNVLHDSAGSGTGFFLSSDGFILTNHHVILMYPDCIAKQFCEIEIEQVAPDNSRKVAIGVRAYVLAYSIQHDFTLLKIKVPQNIVAYPLKLTLGQTEKELFTLGFPGDRRVEGKDITKLTYSFGSPLGFNGLGVVSTVHIAGGASGSPMLNHSTNEVIGLVSNGAGSTSVNGAGNPGIFRPIGLLEHGFGISQYLDGTKQARIKTLIQKLTSTTDDNTANQILLSIEDERSFYGAPYLRELMINHPTKPIRKSILKSLQRMEIVSGKSF